MFSRGRECGQRSDEAVISLTEFFERLGAPLTGQMNASQVERLLAEVVPAIRRQHQSSARRFEERIAALTTEITALRQRALIGKEQLTHSILAQLEAASSERQRRESSKSPNLNCWDVLGLQYSELDHSRVLAWLLDRRQSHAQGATFFRELLRATQSVVPLPLACADEPYRVGTEVSHARSRIDIEIIGSTFLLHIENKVNAEEGEDQTCRERDDLKVKAISRGIDLERAWGLYLSAEGAPCADQEKFRPISWMTVVAAVDSAAAALAAAHPTNVHLPWVLRGYSDVVRRYVVKEKSRVLHLEAD